MECKIANFMLYQQLKLLNAPPFIGLLSLPEVHRTNAIECTRTYLGGHPEKIPNLFREFGYLSGWLVTHTLNDNYGEEDRKVYRLIENTLGVSLDTQTARRNLHQSFVQLCDRMGLPSRGFDRMVDLYLLHAGVARSQLPHLVRAFRRQHDLFGAPPLETTVSLNRWEDDSLDFLPQGIETPRRAILWDETAWHAALYARIAQAPESFTPKNAFEETFYDCFRDEQVGTQSPASYNKAVVQPKLHWTDEGLMLRLPRAQGRIAVFIDGSDRPLRLKGGEDWLLEQPWPRRIVCEIDGHRFELNFLSDQSRFAVFDMTIGRFLSERQVGWGDDIELDTSDALVAARQPFSIAGMDAISLGEDCYVQRAPLGLRPTELTIGASRLSLRTKARRRLIISGGEIADGSSGKLFGTDAMIHVETGLATREMRKIRIASDAGTWLVDIPIDEGRGVLPLSNALSSTPSPDPQRLRLELMAPSNGDAEPRPTGIVLSAWVWPGFERKEGASYLATSAPTNFLQDQSSYVIVSPQGLHLDAKGGYTHANAVFGIEGKTVSFRLPWNDISLQRRRIDGTASTVPLGARISLGAADRHGHISIHCPDRNASLQIGTRHEAAPFALGMTRNLAISDLLGRGGGASVILRRGNGAEVVLFELVDVLEPTRFHLRSIRDGLEISLAFGTRIDAIAIETENEIGERSFHEVALGRWPSRSAPPAWLSARLRGEGAREVLVSVHHVSSTAGLRIGRIFVRPDSTSPNESWRPLRNARGDSFVVPLSFGHDLKDAACDQPKLRFETLSRWMADCYALECWQNPGLERTLVPRWHSLGRIITELPLGSGLLIAASFVPAAEETSPSWVPLAHPVEIDAGLYSATPTAFLQLGELPDDGLRAGARLAALSNVRLRDGLLHAQALMAFDNSRQAQTTDVQLKGFKTEKFFKLFPIFDTDPAAGWFWHGTPLLGPDHLRAAFQQFVERLEAARLFVDEEPETGGNSRRREALRTLVDGVWNRTDTAFRPPMPKRNATDDCPVQTDLWIAVTLSEFARASRRGEAASFVETTAKDLGLRREDVLASLGFLLRLAPELFFYFLLLWQLAKVRP
ncbi:hypothetical protein [Paenirhodobacter hankyongi]|uniref:hypothetical protein n=1 Tax=Paenirhodobacter hankyongi TaxID=2294033 RepID=UPI0011C4A83D|nr:hypothetical protein [Sinirhodobacter hankyongi]